MNRIKKKLVGKAMSNKAAETLVEFRKKNIDWKERVYGNFTHMDSYSYPEYWNY